MAAIETNSVNLTGDAEPVRVAGLRVSTSLFPMLGVQPVAGRLFRPEEEQLGKERVALLGEGLWKSRFGARPTHRRQTDRNRHAAVHRGRRGGAGSAIHGAGPTLRAAGVHSDATGPPRARPSKHRRGGAAEAWGDPRPGPRGDETGGRPHDSQAAGLVSGGLEHRARSAGRFGGGRSAHAAAGAAGRGWHGVADRLRERGQPAAGARHRPPEGDWPAHRAGRGARADRAATADREPAAGGDFGSGRARDRRLGTGVVHAHRLRGIAALADGADQRSGGAVCDHHGGSDQPRFWAGAGAERVPASAGAPQPVEQPAAQPAGGLRGGAFGYVAGGRGPAAAQLCAPVANESGLSAGAFADRAHQPAAASVSRSGAHYCVLLGTAGGRRGATWRGVRRVPSTACPLAQAPAAAIFRSPDAPGPPRKPFPMCRNGSPCRDTFKPWAFH